MRTGARRWVCFAIAFPLVVPALLRAQTGGTPWRDQGVLNLSKSPYAKLHNIPVRAVTIRDGFWAGRRKTAVDKSIPSIWKLIEEHGYVDNFRRLSKGKDVPRKGPVFTDTDPYKWIEGVAMFLQSGTGQNCGPSPSKPSMRSWRFRNPAGISPRSFRVNRLQMGAWWR